MKLKRQFVLLLLSLLLVACSNAQSYNHWTRSFNEESSLLSGAVVGGGAGPSAIYYNPSCISEINESKLSVHASLFSFNFYNVKNALGDDINLKWSNIEVEPRFFSFMIKPKKHPELSFEIALLNNETYRMDIGNTVNMEADILTNQEGIDRYFATVQYFNRYRDDWFGIGGSWKMSDHFYLGISMFVSVKSLEYNYNLNIDAYPLDSNAYSGSDFSYSSYTEEDYIKYNDYRLLWKIGAMYKKKRYSLGICITTPSLGGIYSDGKRVSRTRSQSGISDPETGQPIPDYFVGDFQEKKNVKVNHKSPFSAALGFNIYSKNNTHTFYSTAEYFGGLDPYKIVEANENPNLATNNASENILMNEWLTTVSGAKPVLNIALGHSWIINKDLWLMTGFRTDFNYIKGFDYEKYSIRKNIKPIGVDNYHISGGLVWTVKGQEFITGLQYTLGVEKNQTQIINLSDPVEYNYNEDAPLQGTRQENMNAIINSVSLYIGATFNFGEKSD